MNGPYKEIVWKFRTIAGQSFTARTTAPSPTSSPDFRTLAILGHSFHSHSYQAGASGSEWGVCRSWRRALAPPHITCRTAHNTEQCAEAGPRCQHSVFSAKVWLMDPLPVLQNQVHDKISSLHQNCQSRFDAWYWMLGAGALGRPRGMVWGGRREEGSGWGTHVFLWRIHFDIWQN